MEKAAFAAGCFWGIEKKFRHTQGVTKTQVGYMGGHTKNPSYEEVCTGTTGHAETVEIEYNENQVSYKELLHLFFSIHDPTTFHRQGPDVGSQYRSIIFFYSDKQKKQAEEKILDLEKEKKFSKPIVTEILPKKDFCRAEEYHQCYLDKKRK